MTDRDGTRSGRLCRGPEHGRAAQNGVSRGCGGRRNAAPGAVWAGEIAEEVWRFTDVLWLCC